MINKSMEEKILKQQTIDLSKNKKNRWGDYILTEFTEGMDYCDSLKECYIYSIGRDKVTGEILASTGTKFYLNDEYECLFLR